MFPDKYIIVQWPESQRLMEHDRFAECELINTETGIDLYGSSAYFVPRDLYDEIFGDKSNG